MTGIKEEEQQKIIRVIKALIPKATIYLYGSRARGTFKQGSDVDIAVDTGTKVPRINIGEVKDMLNASNMIYTFDVVDLNNIPNEMKENIIKEGIKWID